MKKIILMLLAIAAIAGASALVLAEEGSTSDKIMAYYFHGSFRCPTCTNMEKYSREAMENNLKDKLASGKLEFVSVDVEKPGNEHYVKDYQLYTKTLILSHVLDGKEIKSKNLDKIWEYARDKKKFIDYVAGETRRFVEESK